MDQQVGQSDLHLQKCFLCDSFADVTRHIGVVHSHEPGFSVVCGIDGCVASYDKFSSYKKHLYRKYAKVIMGISPCNRYETICNETDMEVSSITDNYPCDTSPTVLDESTAETL